MNWDDPEERLRLIERVGPREYNRLIEEHHQRSGDDALRPAVPGGIDRQGVRDARRRDRICRERELKEMSLIDRLMRLLVCVAVLVAAAALLSQLHHTAVGLVGTASGVVETFFAHLVR